MQLRLYKPIRSTRICGECTACCTTCACAALEKPINVKCQHVSERGCSIYEDRPAGCRTYQCAWHYGLLPDKFRPDRCGVVWNFLETRTPDGGLLVQAMLVDPSVTIDQVEYQLAKLQQQTKDRLICQIVSPTLTCKIYGAFHATRVRGNIYVADREATSDDVGRFGIVGQSEASQGGVHTPNPSGG
jgi:hypothetical protein